MPRLRLQDDLKNIGRGVLMGGADIIPGVSGGTVALILGIYEKLIAAISHFDTQLLHHLRARRWRSAAEHVDLRFLLALGAGIVLGIGGLASTMHYLLDHHATLTWAFFFGLILGSSWLVARLVPSWSPATGVAALLGTAFAFWLVGQLPTTAPEGNWYIFLCGCIAICAMILPGISGAFILVLLGMYFPITGILKNALHGDVTPQGLAAIAVFVTGCAIGLLSFCKFLRWLLDRHEALTMATLGGFMIGSLRKIWPFKEDATTIEHLQRLGLPSEKIAAFEAGPQELDLKYRLFENTWPEQWTGDVALAVGLIAAGVVLVLLLDYVSRAPQQLAADGTSKVR